MGKSGCLSTKNANDLEVHRKKSKQIGSKPIKSYKEDGEMAPITVSNITTNTMAASAG